MKKARPERKIAKRSLKEKSNFTYVVRWINLVTFTKYEKECVGVFLCQCKYACVAVCSVNDCKSTFTDQKISYCKYLSIRVGHHFSMRQTISRNSFVETDITNCLMLVKKTTPSNTRYRQSSSEATLIVAGRGL